jgi:hypothetical protein
MGISLLKIKHRWQLKEEELLKMENAYLENLSPFEKLVDNHWTFLLYLVMLMATGFGIGLGIGFLL